MKISAQNFRDNANRFKRAVEIEIERWKGERNDTIDINIENIGETVREYC